MSRYRGTLTFERWAANHGDNPYDNSKAEIVARAAFELNTFVVAELKVWLALEYPEVPFNSQEISRHLNLLRKAEALAIGAARDGDDKRSKRYHFIGAEPRPVVPYQRLDVVRFTERGEEVVTR